MKSMFSSISAKIFIGYAAVLIITLIASVVLSNTSRNVKSQVNTFVNGTLPELNDVQHISSVTSELMIAAYSLYGLTVSVEEFQSVLDKSLNTLKADIDHIQQLNADHDLNNLNGAVDQFSSSLLALGNIMDSRSVDWDGARVQLGVINGQVEAIKTELGLIKDRVRDTAQRSTQLIIADMSSAQTINWIMVAVILLVAVGAYTYARKFVVKPVMGFSDELQRMADSLDLTTRLEDGSGDEVGKAAKGINSLVSVFGAGIKDVVDTSQGICNEVSSLGDVSQRSDASTSQLNTEIDGLVAQMTQLDGQIGQGVQSSRSASETAQQGASEVQSGSQEVERASASISELAGDLEATASMLLELRTSGDKVSTVVSTIAEIADQTNLLALNAAIEAARAGESGRGFAVVADEVRTLATRTHQSTVEINSMLESIVSSITAAVSNMSSNQAKAKHSVELSQSTVESLASIRQTILGLSQECVEVAQSAQAVQQEVASARNQVFEFKSLGDSVAMGSNETRSVSQRLGELANRLDTLSSKFRV